MNDETNKLVEKSEVPASLDEAHLMLGRAISDWGRVEEALCRVFTSCFPLLSSAPAGHAFHEPRSFDTKLKMTSRAVLIAVGPAQDTQRLSSRWHELRKRVEVLSLKRNKLAHGSVVATRPMSESKYSVRFEAFRSAHSYNEAAAEHIEKKLRGGLWATQPVTYSAFGLHSIAADFHTVGKDLREFAHELSTARSEYDYGPNYDRYGGWIFGP